MPPWGMQCLRELKYKPLRGYKFRNDLDQLAFYFSLTWIYNYFTTNYIYIETEIKVVSSGFPWWLSGKESTCQYRRQEDPTCHRTTKLMCPNHWACVLKPRSQNYWAHMLQLLKPICPRTCALQQDKPLQWEARIPQLESSSCFQQLEKSPRNNEDPAQPKIK